MLQEFQNEPGRKSTAVNVLFFTGASFCIASLAVSRIHGLNTMDFTELAHCDVEPFWSMNSLWNSDDRGISLLNIAIRCGNE